MVASPTWQRNACTHHCIAAVFVFNPSGKLAIKVQRQARNYILCFQARYIKWYGPYIY